MKNLILYFALGNCRRTTLSEMGPKSVLRRLTITTLIRVRSEDFCATLKNVDAHFPFFACYQYTSIYSSARAERKKLYTRLYFDANTCATL